MLDRPGECIGVHPFGVVPYNTSNSEMLQQPLEFPQYLSIRYSERLADIGTTPSVGHAGSSYDNALAEAVIGLFKTELIRCSAPWFHLETVEFATRTESIGSIVNAFQAIGDIPPAEAEENFYATLSESAKPA